MKAYIKELCVIFAFILISVFCVKEVINITIPHYPEVDRWEPYVVEAGDTLWNICPKKDHYDIRILIDMVNEYNNIHNDIKTGEVIMLPVYRD